MYITINLQLTDSYRPASSVIYWFTYIMIWLLPAVGLWLGLEKKDRLFIDVNIGITLVTLITNKPYLGLVRKPWDPIVFGLFLMGTAIVIKRWLANGANAQRYGFTATRLLAGDRKVMTVIATASSLLQPDMPAPADTPRQPDFGGGRSGGAGASGTF